MQNFKILMIDDHPMIIEGYLNTILSIKTHKQEFDIDIAQSCDMALEYIQKSLRNKPYDILFIDIKIPPSSDGLITSGEDLAKYVRKVLPHAKIIILTMYNEAFRIHNILKTINPEGFLIKSDLTSNELANAFLNILDKPPYYSSTVNSFLRKTMTSNVIIDEKNRKILHFLSQGIKTKNISERIGLSLSAIEKRKKQLKEAFSVHDGKDETLLEKAKKEGFL